MALRRDGGLAHIPVAAKRGLPTLGLPTLGLPTLGLPTLGLPGGTQR
jgi:hypothetical protein